MDAIIYLADPCGASSLPFWKARQIQLPPGLTVVREDQLGKASGSGRDDPYFKMVHRLHHVPAPALPQGFRLLDDLPVGDYFQHIRACYPDTDLTEEGLAAWRKQPVYAPELWVAVSEAATGQVVATGIGARDDAIGEGSLEWIQISPAFRGRGLGRFVVCELLRRMGPGARFVTVSGRADEAAPGALYASCGFSDPVIWHVLRR